jgi:hypothetical protein
MFLSLRFPTLPLSPERPRQRKEEGEDEPPNERKKLTERLLGTTYEREDLMRQQGGGQAPGPATEAGGGTLRGRCPEGVTSVLVRPIHLLLVAAPVIRPLS